MPGNYELLSFELGLVRLIQCRQINTYSGCIEVDPNYSHVPNYPTNWIQLPNVEESSTSVLGYKHPAGWSLTGDRATKTLSFSMRVLGLR